MSDDVERARAVLAAMPDPGPWPKLTSGGMPVPLYAGNVEGARLAVNTLPAFLTLLAADIEHHNAGAAYFANPVDESVAYERLVRSRRAAHDALVAAMAQLAEALR
jgi:hypothetical protein